jgi:hypothetical protein
MDHIPLAHSAIEHPQRVELLWHRRHRRDAMKAITEYLHFVVPMLPTVILIGLAATTLATEVSKDPVSLTVPHAQKG